MELPVAVSSKLEHHAVIHYLTVRGESASAIYRQLTEIYGDAVTYNVVKRWRCSFLEGRTSLADDESRYVSKLDRNFFADWISKLITWYEKCLSRMGAYVEK